MSLFKDNIFTNALYDEMNKFFNIYIKGLPTKLIQLMNQNFRLYIKRCPL